MMPWLRIPCDLAERDPVEQLAWVQLLSRWHRGQTVTHSELRQLTGWGAGKVVAFVQCAQAWASDNGAAAPEQNRSKTGAKTEQATQGKAPQYSNTGVKSEQNRSETGVSTPKNQPVMPTPKPLKKEIENKNYNPPIPPLAASPSGLVMAGDGQDLSFLNLSDREALSKHGIKTIDGLKAAESRKPIRYYQGIGPHKASRILTALAALEGKPPPVESDNIDAIVNSFLKENQQHASHQ